MLHTLLAASAEQCFYVYAYDCPHGFDGVSVGCAAHLQAMQYAGFPTIGADPDCSNFGLVQHKLVALKSAGSPGAIGQRQRLMLCKGLQGI